MFRRRVFIYLLATYFASKIAHLLFLTGWRSKHGPPDADASSSHDGSRWSTPNSSTFSTSRPPRPLFTSFAAAPSWSTRNWAALSQFFSPEVLAQAQAGNAPPLPPLPTQKAMTLEEIERQAATVRI